MAKDQELEILRKSREVVVLAIDKIVKLFMKNYRFVQRIFIFQSTLNIHEERMLTPGAFLLIFFSILCEKWTSSSVSEFKDC